MSVLRVRDTSLALGEKCDDSGKFRVHPFGNKTLLGQSSRFKAYSGGTD